MFYLVLIKKKQTTLYVCICFRPSLVCVSNTFEKAAATTRQYSQHGMKSIYRKLGFAFLTSLFNNMFKVFELYDL